LYDSVFTALSLRVSLPVTARKRGVNVVVQAVIPNVACFDSFLVDGGLI